MTLASRREGLGRPFALLWQSSLVSNLADGLGRTAVPLIATTLTRDPVLIAGIGAIAFVPWLLFGMPAGVLVDRVDRRKAMAIANGLRVVMALVLALSITTDTLSIWLLYGVVLVFGMGETVYDTAALALMPDTVKRSQLERANGRLNATQTVVDGFIASPVSGLLFGVAISLPVWSTLAGFAAAAGLILLLPRAVGRPLAEPGAEARAGSVRRELVDALQFIRRHRYLRGLVAVNCVTGFFNSLGQAVIVLLYIEHFRTPEAAIGFVYAGVSVGAVLGSLSAEGIVSRFGRGRALIAGSVLDGIGLIGAGAAPEVFSSVAFFAIAGFGVALWNVPWGAVRQELVPGHMLGRAVGAIRTITWGAFPLGTLAGGWLGRAGLTLPTIIGGALVILSTLVAARLLLATPARVVDQ
ncbi:Transmembrane secretion effector [Paramicrobacterium humi]|uniref:Transmembrane secretion effector n=1 Tax=Paramicrobacterium humi TaxID=640635 RepID=A0A1H4Q744_9MICO|nr:MFS transporter [Microbacterium humi]SEC15417.1 Transmembrane secretion effector [Microbacterium humi]